MRERGGRAFYRTARAAATGRESAARPQRTPLSLSGGLGSPRQFAGRRSDPETALGGPDTTTRIQTVWQVKLLQVTDPGGTLSCDTPFPQWNEMLQRNLIDIPNVGRMAARSQTVEPSPDPLCTLPPNAGYRRLENQLYRVEVHQGGSLTQARFKWSRDNGTVEARMEQDANGNLISGSQIIVAEIGKDGLLTFASDPLPEWLELSDDRYELTNQHGH